MQFNFYYKDLLNNVMQNGIDIYNKRTKSVCRTLPGAHIRIDCTGWKFPLLTMRKLNIKAICAEMFWFCMGEDNPSNLLNDYTSIWKEFTEDSGIVFAAYGRRMRHFFGRDQLQDMLDTLEDDPSSRQCVVCYWDPSSDGLLRTGLYKNVPCPYTFTVNIIGGKVCLHLIIRSNDIVLGHPYDVSGHALLMFMIAAHLGYEPGIISVSMSNAHIYENHFDGVPAILEQPVSTKSIIFEPKRNLLGLAMEGNRQALDKTIKEISDQYHPHGLDYKFNITL